MVIPTQYTIAFRDGMSTYWSHLLIGMYGAPPFESVEAACTWFEERKQRIHNGYQVRVYALMNGDVGREVVPDLRAHINRNRRARIIAQLRGIFQPRRTA